MQIPTSLINMVWPRMICASVFSSLRWTERSKTEEKTCSINQVLSPLTMSCILGPLSFHLVHIEDSEEESSSSEEEEEGEQLYQEAIRIYSKSGSYKVFSYFDQCMLDCVGLIFPVYPDHRIYQCRHGYHVAAEEAWLARKGNYQKCLVLAVHVNPWNAY